MAWHGNKWGMQSRSSGFCLSCWTRPRGTGWGCLKSPSLVSVEEMRLGGRREACVPEVKKQAWYMQWRDDLRMFHPKWKAKNKQKTRSSKPCQIQLGLVWSGYFSAEAAIYSFLFFFLIGGYLLCNVVLVSAIQLKLAVSIYLCIPLEPPHPSHSFRLSQSNQFNWRKNLQSVISSETS